MNKKTYFILTTVLMVTAIILSGILASRYIEQQLNESLVNQFSNQERLTSLEVSKNIEDEVQSLRNKLNLIAQIPEIREGNTVSCNNKIKEITSGLNGKISNIGRVSLDKTFKCSFNPQLVGLEATKLGPYINDIFNDPAHKPVMSRAIKAPGVDGYAIAIHVPVLDKNNKFNGTVGGAMYMNELNKRHLENISLLQNGSISLYDDDGTILFHSKQEFVGTNILENQEFKKLFAEEKVIDELLSSVKRGEGGVLRYHFEGVEEVLAYAPTQVFPGRNWIIAVEVPTSAIYAKIFGLGVNRLITLMVIIIGSVVLLSSFIFLIIMIRTIFNPIDKIVQVSEEIGQGNFDTKINIGGADEVGKLSKAINTMASKLKLSYHNLEDLVRERTKALDESLKKMEVQNIQLDEEKNKIEAILSSIGDGVLVVDTKGFIMMMNKVSLGYTGYSWEESKGKHYSDIFKFRFEDFLDKEYPDFIDAVIKTGTPKGMANHTVLVRKNNEIMPIADSAAPVKDDKGNMLGCVVVMRNVEKEREIEKTKDNFISVAAHQLRTPLGSMRWNLEMILDGDYGKAPAKMEEILHELSENNLRLIVLVNSLLDVSRINDGRVRDEPKQTDIHTVINSVIKEVSPLAKQKKVQMESEKDESIPEILIDPSRLHEVIENLISNAIKYNIPQGKVSINTKKMKNKIEIRIADTGIGIPQDASKNIFSKFYRAGNAVLSQTEGSGLGLFVAKSFVEGWGGTITFESQEKKGTTFIISLPLEPKQHTLDHNINNYLLAKK